MAEGADLYERDLVRWAEEQAAALRAAAASRTNLPLDWDRLAEEIDALGKSVRSELRNRLATIIEHLFKLYLSPAEEPRAGWIETVRRERIEVEGLLNDNPSLRSTLPETLVAADLKARKLVQTSLERYGVWAADTPSRLNRTRFTDPQILDVARGSFAQLE